MSIAGNDLLAQIENDHPEAGSVYSQLPVACDSDHGQQCGGESEQRHSGPGSAAGGECNRPQAR